MPHHYALTHSSLLPPPYEGALKLAEIAEKTQAPMGNITKNQIFVGSRISKLLRPVQRYDNFKLIKFKKPSKTAVVSISGTPCPRHITVLFGAEAPSGHVTQA